MAFRLLIPRSPLALGLGLTAAYATTQAFSARPSRFLMCQSPSSATGSATSSWSYSHNASAPVLTREGRVNPAVYRQISSGSILGLFAGLAVGFFSKPLTLLIGLLLFAIQFASSRGINVLPYDRLQRFVRGVDLRFAFQDNIAFKLSFGASFAIAAFVPL